MDSSTALSIYIGIQLLIEHLDIVYNDTEAWSELADTYEKLGMFVLTNFLQLFLSTPH